MAPISGVDFTVALYIQQDREEVKVYICLFTCATTRAVNLEVVTNLSTETLYLPFVDLLTYVSSDVRSINTS